MKLLRYGTALAALFTVAGCNSAPSSAQPTAAATTRATAPVSQAGSAPAQAPTGSAPVDPQQVSRISPDEARAKVQAGRALLVCAYDDRGKCDKAKLEGSIAYADLLDKLPELGTDQEIILYCA